jgi:exodeoxyribonuclease VII small subunit
MSAKNNTSYKEAYTELENIVHQIDSDELDVDELSDKVKRATELLTFCRKKLLTTEQEIEEILKKIEEDI